MLCALCASPLAIWSRLRCRSRPRAASAVRFISPRPLPHSSCRNAACPGAASAVSWQGHVNGNVAGCGNELGSTCAENQVPLRTVVGPVTLCAQWHARHRVELPGAAAGRCTVEDPVGAAMAIALAQRSFLALLRACTQPFPQPAPADDTAGCRECSRHACWACRFRESIVERNRTPGSRSVASQLVPKREL